MKSSWYYDEFKRRGEDYENIAGGYDERMHKVRNIKEEAEKIKNIINLQTGDLLLEIGTGTGFTVLALAKYCKNIIAIDTSSAMIKIAKEKSESKNINNIEFMKGGFLTFDSQEKYFDKVITVLTLHHLPDFWKFIALKRIYSILKDNGLLFIMDIVFRSDIDNPINYFNNLIKNMRDYSSEDVAKSMEIRIKELYPTFDSVMKNLIQSAGFKLIKEDKDKEFTSIYVCKKIKKL